jgi:hypothetical protein
MRDESPSICDIRALRLCVPLSVSVVLAKTQGPKKKSMDESGPSSDDIETAHALPLFSALRGRCQSFLSGYFSGRTSHVDPMSRAVKQKVTKQQHGAYDLILDGCYLLSGPTSKIVNMATLRRFFPRRPFVCVFRLYRLVARVIINIRPLGASHGRHLASLITDPVTHGRTRVPKLTIQDRQRLDCPLDGQLKRLQHGAQMKRRNMRSLKECGR